MSLISLLQMPYLQNEVPHSTYLVIAVGGGLMRVVMALAQPVAPFPSPSASHRYFWLRLYRDCGPAPAATLPCSDLRY